MPKDLISKIAREGMFHVFDKNVLSNKARIIRDVTRRQREIAISMCAIAIEESTLVAVGMGERTMASFVTMIW